MEKMMEKRDYKNRWKDLMEKRGGEEDARSFDGGTRLRFKREERENKLPLYPYRAF